MTGFSYRGRMREKIFTTPNVLTLSRLPMAGAVWLAPQQPGLVIPLMIAAAVTDLLDGRFARMIRQSRVRRGQDPGQLAGARGIGAWLDPLCDKIFVVSLLAAIYVANRPELYIVLLVGAREAFLVPLVAAYRLSPTLRERSDFDLRAGWPGKLATVAQFAAVGSIVLEPRLTIYFAIASGVLGLLATYAYTRRFVRSYRGSAARH